MLKIVFILILLFPSLLFADDICTEEEKTEKLQLFGLAASFTPVAIQLGIILHESSHVGAAVLMGEEITYFSVLPHRKDERFLLGEVRTDRSVFDRSPAENIFFYSAPYILNTSMIITSDVLLRTDVVRRKSPEGVFLFISGIVIPFVGHTYNWIGGLTHDKWDWGRIGGEKYGVIPQIIGGFVISYGLATIINHLQNL